MGEEEAAKEVNAALTNSDSKFRSVTVRHVATRESFAHQTFTASDEEALSFARQTFSDRIYECSKLEDGHSDSGPRPAERERALVYSGGRAGIRTAEPRREEDGEDDARPRAQAEFAAFGDELTFAET